MQYLYPMFVNQLQQMQATLAVTNEALQGQEATA